MIYNKIKYYEDAIVIPDINLAFTVEYPQGMPSAKYRDMAYGNNRFIGTSTAITAYTTDDGATWNASSTYGTRVFYGNGYYIIMNNYIVYASNDCVTWTDITPIQNNASITFDAIAFDGTNFLIVGHEGHNVLSWVGNATLSSWKQISSFSVDAMTVSKAECANLIYIPSDKVYRAMFYNVTSEYAFNISSQTWSNDGGFLASQNIDFAYNEANGMYIAMGPSLEIAVKKSWKATWGTKTLVIDTTDYSMSKILAAKGHFFVLIYQYDGNATVAYSKDGNDWKYAPIKGTGLSDAWYRMAVGDNKAIIMSQQNNIAISNLN